MKNVDEMTRDELRIEAKERNIAGRGSMKADELRTAVQASRDSDQINLYAEQATPGEWQEIGIAPSGGRVFMASVGIEEPFVSFLPTKDGYFFQGLLPVQTTRYRDRVRNGSMIVRTPNGQAPTLQFRTRPKGDGSVVGPMSTKRRTLAYALQNGERPLTRRQLRQIQRMKRRGAPAE